MGLRPVQAQQSSAKRATLSRWHISTARIHHSSSLHPAHTAAHPAASNAREITSRDSLRCFQLSKWMGTIVASENARAAWTPSSAVMVRANGPTTGTRAAPIKMAEPGASAKATTKPVTAPRSAMWILCQAARPTEFPPSRSAPSRVVITRERWRETCDRSGQDCRDDDRGRAKPLSTRPSASGARAGPIVFSRATGPFWYFLPAGSNVGSVNRRDPGHSTNAVGPPT
jgi:hypothetical protein